MGRHQPLVAHRLQGGACADAVVIAPEAGVSLRWGSSNELGMLRGICLAEV
ncbi:MULTISPECIES: hypothetical protein [unclassified Streptomyces]|uniref:hypothetical protein n=1 Tax=unclassified Streptomyces TaxID=2593676 RepID=UPI002DD7B0DA|nr:hypothetical protein [Streptomyces sp. NBC_01788]WSB30783.1 hypothetical protein OIE49_35750 [Streptomyces sp. NBC_01788]